MTVIISYHTHHQITLAELNITAEATCIILLIFTRHSLAVPLAHLQTLWHLMWCIQREDRRKQGDVTILPVFVPSLHLLHMTMIMTQVTHSPIIWQRILASVQFFIFSIPVKYFMSEQRTYWGCINNSKCLQMLDKFGSVWVQIFKFSHKIYYLLNKFIYVKPQNHINP